MNSIGPLYLGLLISLMIALMGFGYYRQRMKTLQRQEQRIPIVSESYRMRTRRLGGKDDRQSD